MESYSCQLHSFENMFLLLFFHFILSFLESLMVVIFFHFFWLETLVRPDTDAY